MHSVMVSLPWFDPRLHSHNKGSWQAKRGPVARAREAAHIATLGVFKRNGIDPPKWSDASVRYTFRVPDNRRRDLVNMMQSCKAYLDGIVDAGLIVGDHWQVLGVSGAHAVVSDPPGVDLVFVRSE